MNQKVYIEGMHCAMCLTRVTRVFSSLEEVTNVEVDLTTKCATLSVIAPIAEDRLKETVENMGFDFIRTE